MSAFFLSHLFVIQGRLNEICFRGEKGRNEPRLTGLEERDCDPIQTDACREFAHKKETDCHSGQ